LDILLPDRGEHPVRYYGWYNNPARGMRDTTSADSETAAAGSLIEGMPEHVDRDLPHRSDA